jgi:hypothetical protein
MLGRAGGGRIFFASLPACFNSCNQAQPAGERRLALVAVTHDAVDAAVLDNDFHVCHVGPRGGHDTMIDGATTERIGGYPHRDP